MAFELGAVVGTAALEWVAGKLLDGAQAKLGPDADLSRAIGEALDQADQAVPELFASCHRDGMQGLDSFLKGFLAHSAVLQELQKPVTGKGAPDAEILEEVFRQALAALEEPQRVTKENLLPGVRFKEADKLQLDRLMPWMKAFAEGYFQRMPDGVRFWVARADYCEQLRNRFDVVRFGGIDVAIDRAEKLADIFVMPDVREETNRRSFAEANATWAPMETELDEVTGKTRIIHPELRNFDETSFTTQQLLLLEQQKESNWRRNQEKGQIVSEKELLKQNRRAVLLGAPGSGKTTLMSYWAVATCAAEAEAAVSDLPDNCLPILIRIRDLARQPEMGVLEFAQDFAQRELSAKALPQGFFEYWLDNGQALILLDGLDEVADTAQRYKVVTKIEAFLGQFAENAAIITSRPSGYKRDFFRTEEYPHYELQPFNDQQIDQFIDCWYERRYELERDRQQAKEGLRKALAAQPRIKQLARNPLLLTMIGLIHLSRARLPQKRYELYDLAVKTLLLNWDEHKQIRDKKLFKYLDDTDDLRRLMEQLAYWIHSQGGTGDEEGGTLIDREELLTQLSSFIEEMKGVKRHQAKEEAKRFLDKVVRDRAGLLAQQGQDRYAFVHKTFQEYLTAMELYERKSDGIDEVLAEIELHLHDSHWEEVLLLLIAQLRKKEFSRSLQVIWNYQEPYQNWLHRNLFFVGLCLAENLPLTRDGLDQTAIAKLIELEVNSSPLVTSKLKQKVFKSLNGLAETPLAREVMKQLEANEAISSERLLDYRQKLQPEQAVIELLTLLKDDDSKVRYRAAESLGELGNASESVVEGLLALLKDDDSKVRYRAAESLGELGNASESVVEGLLALLKYDSWNVRDLAASSLGKLGNASESVVEGLLALLKDDDSKVRYLAASSLGELDNASESVVEALLALLKDDDSKVRYLAASSLVKLDNTSESVVEGLLELLKDETNFVAKNRIGRINNYAATSLTQLGKKSDKVLPALIQWIEQNENQPYVGNGIDVLSELVN